MKNFSFVIYWLARLAAAFLMLQTLYYKFTASEESVYIFQTVGLEPLGRVSVGIIELAASILILINSTAWVGAVLAVCLMIGAIVSHLFILGISVRGDGGLLFSYAIIVLISAAYVLVVNRQKLTDQINKLAKS